MPRQVFILMDVRREEEIDIQLGDVGNHLCRRIVGQNLSDATRIHVIGGLSVKLDVVCGCSYKVREMIVCVGVYEVCVECKIRWEVV